MQMMVALHRHVVRSGSIDHATQILAQGKYGLIDRGCHDARVTELLEQLLEDFPALLLIGLSDVVDVPEHLTHFEVWIVQDLILHSVEGLFVLDVVY